MCIHMARRQRPSEAGVMVAAFGLWLTVALLSCLLIVGVAGRASERTAAQSAADATALAGAAGGRSEAEAIAQANDAKLIEFHQDGSVVTVRIERAGIHADARAEKQIRLAGRG